MQRLQAANRGLRGGREGSGGLKASQACQASALPDTSRGVVLGFIGEALLC